MNAIFVTDLHGSEWKYDLVFEIAKRLKADVVINAGDMLPKHGDLFQQGGFITSFLDGHFKRFEDSGIYYLCYLEMTTSSFSTGYSKRSVTGIAL